MRRKNKISIGIIGFGNFGTLLATALVKHFDVVVHNHKRLKENVINAKKIGVRIDKLELVAKSDVVILSVPISETKALIKKVAPLMKAGSTLVDTCSVKVLPCKWLEKYTDKNIQILGTHPMFGPTTTNFDIDKKSYKLDGLQMVLCPIRIKKQNLATLEKFLKKLKIKPITTSPEDHDKQNAKTLSFVHFIGRSLLSAGIGHQEIYTPGYTDLLKILPHTTGDKWQLFFDMNNYNPYSGALREKFRDAGLDLEEKIIHNQEKDEFEKNRDMIDLLDKRILKLLEKRFSAVKQIGEIKKDKHIKIVDKERETSIINDKKKMSHLNDEFVEKFYKFLFNESYKLQK